MTYRTQLKFPDGLVERCRELLSRHATESADERQIFGDGKFLIDRRSFGQIADLSLHVQWLIGTIKPRYAGVAFSRRHEAREDPHRGRFARAIRAKECQHLSFGHREGDAINSRMMAVPLCNVLNVDHESDIGANN